MCGIVGAIAVGGSRNALAESFVKRALAYQHTRGPDATGLKTLTWRDSAQIWLGHNRLAIIDRTARAQQPMRLPGFDTWLTYNGEIHNYLELCGGSGILPAMPAAACGDSETLLAGWNQFGTNILQHLNGMFAFAVWDHTGGTLTLVRDRFGQKPLYFAQIGGLFCFASSARPIAEITSRTPDRQYLSRGVHTWYFEDDSDLTQYASVRQLPAAHFMTLRIADGQLHVGAYEKYYDLDTQSVALSRSFELQSDTDLVDRVQDLLQDSIRLRLRSDVPVGISLSGGLDSSSVAHYTTQLAGAGIPAYSFGSREIAGTEAQTIADASDQLNTQPIFVWPNTKDMPEYFFASLRAQDAPFSGLGITAQWCLYNQARQDGVRVMLGGQGSDEIFAGYRKFALLYAYQLAASGDLRALARVCFGFLPTLMAENLRLISTYGSSIRRYVGTPHHSLLELPALDARPLQSARSLRAAALQDIQRYSLPTLIRYEERNSMANSVESRLPFLDHRLVELALALPDRLKVNDGYGKWILRHAVAGRVPDSIRLQRRKRGFDFPLHDWLAGGVGAAIRDQLTVNWAAASEWLQSNAKSESIDSLFSDYALEHSALRFTEATTLLWLDF